MGDLVKPCNFSGIRKAKVLIGAKVAPEKNTIFACNEKSGFPDSRVTKTRNTEF